MAVPRTVPLLLAMLLMAASCTSSDSTDTPATGSDESVTRADDRSSYEATDCRFENVTGFRAECGDLRVPEDRNDPDSRLISLHVAVFPSLSPTPAPDPLVYLDGGPGGETLERMSGVFGEVFLPFLQDRDVVIFDQRGVGFSEPSLACPEVREVIDQRLDQPYGTSPLDATGAAWQSCRDRLVADGVDLSSYNSAAGAADLADLRRALGYERWNLLGVSYGSRLALTVLRDESAGVRAVVLDSAYPPQLDPTEVPGSFDRALGLLFATCNTDPGCASDYPDLQARFFALADRLEAEPVLIPITDMFRGTRRELLLDGKTLIELFFEGMYSAAIIRRLPQAIAQIEDGTHSLISGMASAVFAQRDVFSIGVYPTVMCHEEYSFTTVEQFAAARERHPELNEYFLSTLFYGPAALELCELWPSGLGGEIENQPVTSDLPVLVLAGAFDPITPPSWGLAAAETLDNSRYYEFPSIGHGAVFEHHCPRSMVLQFLENPEAEPDDSCIAGIAAIDFAG